MLAWNPPPKSPPAGAAAGVAPALAPEVAAPNNPPEGAVVVVGDANIGEDAAGFAAPPPKRFDGAAEAGVDPNENPPGFVVAAPPPPPKRPPVGCLLSVAPAVVVWPKRLVVGAPDDAGVVDCPKRLPPVPPVPPVAPKLKDILGEIRQLRSSRMAINQ